VHGLAASQDESGSDDSDMPENGRSRRRPLDNPVRVRREVAKLYWRWNDGDLGAEDVARMAGVLRILRLMLVGPVLEQRLAAVEQKLAELADGS
jgi:hypothetical protein